MSRYSLFDNETGEIVEEIRGRFISEEQDQAFRKKLAKQNGRCEGFTFMNIEAVQEIVEQLSTEDLGRLLYLQTYIYYDSVLVIGQKHKPMTKREIQQLIGLERHAFGQFMKRLLFQNILIENIDGSFSMNELYHFKGSTSGRQCVKVFCTRIRELYRSKSLTVADLGIMYRLAPYIHYETNILCTDPSEVDITKAKPLSQTEIMIITGLKERAVRNKLQKMQFNGMRVFVEEQNGRNKHYKLNPLLLYRKDGSSDQSEIGVFKLS
ncbi:hypothetical protein [Bacillus cereus]|uniref:hypothetical protein n=1 Tax=Bacillus cereus TaxID=1396 RepID=UPI0020D284A5|nr:hypothetical protein [Bacillus cereus]